MVLGQKEIFNAVIVLEGGRVIRVRGGKVEGRVLRSVRLILRN